MKKRDIVFFLGITTLVLFIFEYIFNANNAAELPILGMYINVNNIKRVFLINNQQFLHITGFNLNLHDFEVNQILEPVNVSTEKPSQVKPLILIGILGIFAIFLIIVSYKLLKVITPVNYSDNLHKRISHGSNIEDGLFGQKSLILQSIINDSTTIAQSIKKVIETKYHRKLQTESGLEQNKLLKNSLKNWFTSKADNFTNQKALIDLAELLRGTDLLNSYS